MYHVSNRPASVIIMFQISYIIEFSTEISDQTISYIAVRLTWHDKHRTFEGYSQTRKIIEEKRNIYLVKIQTSIKKHVNISYHHYLISTVFNTNK